MDKALISRRFAKAVGTYLDKADVQRYVASRMAELTGRYIPSDIQERVLEIGCGTGMFTRMYLQQAVPEEMWLNDLCPEVEPYLADVLGEKVHFMAKDAETLAFPEGQDLIVSCSAVQWFEDLPRFFSGCRKLLHEGGYLAFSTFGPHNTEEVATLTAAGLSYPSLEELKEILAARYEVVYAHEEQLRLSFSSPLDVLKHLKETGVTGTAAQPWTRGRLQEFCRNYTRQFSDERGKVGFLAHPQFRPHQRPLPRCAPLRTGLHGTHDSPTTQVDGPRPRRAHRHGLRPVFHFEHLTTQDMQGWMAAEATIISKSSYIRKNS